MTNHKTAAGGSFAASSGKKETRGFGLRSNYHVEYGFGWGTDDQVCVLNFRPGDAIRGRGIKSILEGGAPWVDIRGPVLDIQLIGFDPTVPEYFSDNQLRGDCFCCRTHHTLPGIT